MFIRSAILSGLAFCFANLSAQSTFKNAYGGALQDGASDVKPTLDGGYVLCGETFTFGSQYNDQYVIKTDSAGNMQWTRTVAFNYGGNSNNAASEIVQLSDSSYVYVGHRNTASASYSNLVKLSPMGDTVWVRTFIGSTWFYSNSLKLTSDGGFVFAGTTSSTTSGNVGFCLVKCDSLGYISWSKLYEDPAGVYFWEVLVTPDSGYILAGERTRPVTFDKDFYVIKTNSLGDTLWTRTYSSPGINDDRLYAATITLDGGMLLTGFSSGYSAGNDDILLLKLNSNGSIEWCRDLGSSNGDYSRMSTQLPDSGYVVVGTSQTSFICKLNSLGNLQWVKSTGYHSPRAVQLTLHGQLVVAGWTFVVGGGDVYLAVTDTAYHIECGESGMAMFCNDVTAGITYGSSSPQVFSNLIIEISSPDTISAGGSLTNICLTDLRENTASSNFNKLYPVPANNELHLESATECKFIISDGLGQVILTGSAKSRSNIIDVTAFANGVYYFHSTDTDGNSFNAPLIVMHQ